MERRPSRNYQEQQNKLIKEITDKLLAPPRSNIEVIALPQGETQEENASGEGN